MDKFDVVVIGGGPAGLAAAISAKEEGASVLTIEREGRLGGILKQCIHDGFGIIKFKEKLSGPEYAQRYIEIFHKKNIEYRLLTFVINIEKRKEGFEITLVSKEGISAVFSKTLILATGCRERTSKQIFIHGTRPAGVYTAGTAQHFTNLLGEMVTKECVILGSGDIGLIMARRLTLEGAKVKGVYEAKSTPSGLTRNLLQCLEDYDIPLHLSHTVTRIIGDQRLEAVAISKVDEKMKPIEGTEEIVPCDSLILSVGLIPENELAESLSITIDGRTSGPACDPQLMTDVEGIFSCGNALHVNDLVDYVSESGEIAGKNAAKFAKEEKKKTRYEPIIVKREGALLYFLPQVLPSLEELGEIPFYFRSNRELDIGKLTLTINGEKIEEKKYNGVKPPEMEKLVVNFKGRRLEEGAIVKVCLTGGRDE